jgi:hypothetical protein
MCNGGASKSKSVEVLRLFTVPSVGASASMAIRTWDNQRQTKNYDRSFVDRGLPVIEFADYTFVFN